jgi:hypothetical protein
MAQDETRDDLDRDEPDTGEDVRGIGEDDDLEEDEDAEDLEDDEQFEADERLTGEVGSEGGSPGEAETDRRDRADEPLTGSESTTTSKRGR